MITQYPFNQFKAFSPTLSKYYRADEATCVAELIPGAQLAEDQLAPARELAAKLIEKLRAVRTQSGGLDAFLATYDLSSEEGIALMCLAEALLRIPDSATADKLIADKIGSANWEAHLGESHSWFVNAATWALLLTGKTLNPQKNSNYFLSTLQNLIKKSGTPIIRVAMKEMMEIVGKQYVQGQTIEEGIKRAKKYEAMGYRYSYDMLGEGARTEKDALGYQKIYQHAINAIGKSERLAGVYQSPGISIKLSALMPRYTVAQIDRVMAELLPRVKELCLLAKSYDISLTIDAEESERLQLSLALIEILALDPELSGWNGFGLAIQAYQKRTPYTIDFLVDLAKRANRRLMVRLVKGAYWDSEIKRAQELGLEGYATYTRKVYTDVSYLTCAKKILEHTDVIYPMFATHNAYSLAVILQMAGDYRDFEFQCLHGMGESLYNQIVGKENLDIACRIYAPCGGHEYLLAYLVRRLLENGANSSFVNRIVDEKVPVEDLLKDSVAQAEALKGTPHPRIPLPRNIFGDRANARGLDLSNTAVLEKLAQDMEKLADKNWSCVPLIATERNDRNQAPLSVTNPTDHTEIIGTIIEADSTDVELALTRAVQAFAAWQKTTADHRAKILEKMADLLEEEMPKFMLLAIKEAGKSVANSVGEVREAIDFCRYYAQQARYHFSKPIVLQGVTGETNQISLHGRGVVACISPWNFPLAIFLGEVTAALAAGNVVIAKPAEQTPLIAYEAVKLLYEAGIPKDVLQLLPGKGEVVGAKLTTDPRVCGVIFTGSNITARLINKALAEKEGPISFLVAETGGQNALIVDSSALKEQVVDDVIASAFDSAGQRCSALRVLYLQDEIADSTIEMIKGAMDQLSIGNPAWISTDVGPVIDAEAQANLLRHIENLPKEGGQLLHQAKLSSETEKGTFVPPTLFEIPSIRVLKQEVFGPVLHVIRYRSQEIEKVLADINSTGFGLTFGVHSRIDTSIDYLEKSIHAGNTYINRNIIGAVVGVQPFGGEGLSGTGPKAGGPHYLPRLAIERVVSINTAAAGGNASLIGLQEE